MRRILTERSSHLRKRLIRIPGIVLLTFCLSSFLTTSDAVPFARLWSRQLHSAPSPESTSPTEREEKAQVSGKSKGEELGQERTEYMPYMAALDPRALSTHCNITSLCVPCTTEQQENEAACGATGFHQELICIENFAHGGSSSGTGTGRGNSESGRSESSESTRKHGASSKENSDSVTNTSSVLQGAGLKEEGQDSSENQEARDGDGSSKEEAADQKVGRSLRSEEKEGIESSGASSEGGKAEVHAHSQSSAARGQHRQGFRKYVTFEACSPVEEETLSVFGFEAIMLSLLAVCAPVVYQRKRKGTSQVAMTRIPSGSRL